MQEEAACLASSAQGKHEGVAKFRGGTMAGLVLFLGDAAAVASALFLGTEAARLVYGGLRVGLGSERVKQAVAMAVLFLAWFWMNGHYRRRMPLLAEFREVVAAAAVLLFADLYLQLMFSSSSPSRVWICAVWGLAAGFILIARVVLKRLLFKIGPWQCRTLVIGRAGMTGVLEALLRGEPHLGYVPCGVVDTSEGDPAGKVRDCLAAPGVGYAVIGCGSVMDKGGIELARIVDEEFRVPLGLVLELPGISLGGLEIRYTVGAEVLVLSGRRGSKSSLQNSGKRLLDIGVALVVLAAAAPALLLIAALVKLDGGPALYPSARIGKNGTLFNAFKFRSMVPNAEAALHELLSRDPAARSEWAMRFKLRNDPRITWIGRFLRRTSLDELPQLINVVRGEMSLVGPRPMLPDERSRYGEEAFALYSIAKPGMTGIWQVSGRDELDYVRRVELNSWYVRNWSPWLDLFILAKTALAVARRSSAS